MKASRNKVQSPSRLSYAFITGASSGIGAAVAEGLAQQGYGLVLTARRTDRLKKLAERCRKLGAPAVIVKALDVTKSAEIAKVAKSLSSEKLNITVLINNAGLAKGIGPFQGSGPADTDLMLDTNVRGLLHVTRAFLDGIIAGHGHIVNIGSVAGRHVYEGGTVYCATKFAVGAISDALRLDLKGTGVRVTNILPGMVNTEFSVVRLGNQQKADAVYADMMPLSATDVANSVLWCVTQPAHVNISELVIYPTDQAGVGHVVRGEKSVKSFLKK